MVPDVVAVPNGAPTPGEPWTALHMMGKWRPVVCTVLVPGTRAQPQCSRQSPHSLGQGQLWVGGCACACACACVCLRMCVLECVCVGECGCPALSATQSPAFLTSPWT